MSGPDWQSLSKLDAMSEIRADGQRALWWKLQSVIMDAERYGLTVNTEKLYAAITGWEEPPTTPRKS